MAGVNTSVTSLAPVADVEFELGAVEFVTVSLA